jgi:hypothetical protein
MMYIGMVTDGAVHSDPSCDPAYNTNTLGSSKRFSGMPRYRFGLPLKELRLEPERHYYYFTVNSSDAFILGSRDYYPGATIRAASTNMSQHDVATHVQLEYDHRRIFNQNQDRINYNIRYLNRNVKTPETLEETARKYKVLVEAQKRR